MSSNRFLCLPVILTLALVLALAAAGATALTVWVAPTEGECQGKSPCGTLQDLWLSNTSVNIISDSNTTWVFLPGVHKLNSTQCGLILFWQVSNVVLSGSELCERKKEECTIVCASYLCIFLFIESHNITIQHLSIVYSNSRYLPLLNFNPEIPFKLIPSCQQIQLSSGTRVGDTVPLVLPTVEVPQRRERTGTSYSLQRTTGSKNQPKSPKGDSPSRKRARGRSAIPQGASSQEALSNLQQLSNTQTRRSSRTSTAKTICYKEQPLNGKKRRGDPGSDPFFLDAWRSRLMKVDQNRLKLRQRHNL